MKMVIEILTLPVPKTMSFSLEIFICCSPCVAPFLQQHPGSSHLFRKVDCSLRGLSHMNVLAVAIWMRSHMDVLAVAIAFAITCKSPITALEVPATRVTSVVLGRVFHGPIAETRR